MESTATERKTLLLVEDEAIIALAQAERLRQRGYHVIAAMNADEALAVVKKNRAVDLVLMDIDLGRGMDGTETARHILRERDLPIVFLSSHSESDIVEKTEQITSFGYILKTAGETVLDASIKMAFRLYESQRRLRESESAVIQEQRMLSLVLENLPALVAYIGADERYIYANFRYAAHFGFNAERLAQEDSREVLGPVLYAEVAQYVTRALSGELVSFEQTRPTSSGAEKTVYVTYVPDVRRDGFVRGFFSLGVDVTDRKMSEMQVVESREQLRAVLNSIGDGVIVTDRSARILGMNPVAERLTGWPLGVARGTRLSEVFPIIDNRTGSAASNPLVRAMAENRVLALANHTVLVTRDGVRRHIADSGAPIHGPGGLVEGGVMVFRDVSDEYQVQARLETSERQLRNLFENMAEAVALHGLVEDDDGAAVDYRIVDCNPRFEEITGISRERAVGRLATALYGTPEAPYLAEYSAVVRSGEPRRIQTFFEPLGREFLISCIPWEENGFATVFTDISELRSAVGPQSLNPSG